LRAIAELVALSPVFLASSNSEFCMKNDFVLEKVERPKAIL
jgi:hypothetical protein